MAEKHSGKSVKKVDVKKTTESYTKRKQSVFITLFLGIIVLAFAFLFNLEEIVENIFWLIGLILLVAVFWQSEIILFLKDYERAVIFKFGKVNRVGGPGWALMIPIIEDYELVDLRVQVVDTKVQEVVTNDNIELTIDALAWIRVGKDNQSVINSATKVKDWKGSISSYVPAALRNIIGTVTMNEVIGNMERINERMKKEIQKLSEEWGVFVDTVEISDVQIPDIIMQAMHEQRAAEREKLERFEKAAAHKEEINTVKEAAAELSDKALSYYYIRALEKMSEGKSTKIVFPMEISKLAAAISGKISPVETEKIDPKLIQAAAPILANLLKSEKKKREQEENEEKK